MPHLGEHTAADQMPVFVVHLLEIVQVDKDQAELSLEAPRPFNLRLHLLVKVTHVEQSRAFVGDGQLLNTLHRARILNGDRRVVAQHMQKRNRIVAQRVQAAVDKLDDSQRTQARTQRHANRRPHPQRLALAIFIDRCGKPRVEAGILAHLRNNQALAVRRHPSRNAMADWNSETSQIGLGVPDGDRVVKLLAPLVQKQQRPCFRLEELLHLLHDRSQNCVPVERGSQRSRYIVKNQQVPQIGVVMDRIVLGHRCSRADSDTLDAPAGDRRSQ